MKWSMYTGATTVQCMPGPATYPATQYHERDDALQFAGWNTVSVKADNCGGSDDTLIQRYTDLSNALQSVGIKGLDIAPYLENTDWTQHIFRMTNEAIQLIRNNKWGPGHFGNMDGLEVGNQGMTSTQQASHFAIWAMFKSPLMISTSLSQISSATKKILGNKALIAINQDSLGAPVGLVQRFPTYDLYAGPLANGDMAVLLVDQSGNGGTLSVNFAQLNITTATVKELWNGTSATGKNSWSEHIEPYGSVPLRLSQVSKANPAAVKYNFIQGSSGSYANGASSQNCPACQGGQSAGFLGGGQNNGGGSVPYSGIKTSKSKQNILIDYINAEYTYPDNEPGINARGAQISVNGGNAVKILFPVSGYDWTKSILSNFAAELNGFSTTGPNTITITGIPNGVPNTSNFAPNIAGLRVVA